MIEIDADDVRQVRARTHGTKARVSAHGEDSIVWHIHLPATVRCAYAGRTCMGINRETNFFWQSKEQHGHWRTVEICKRNTLKEVEGAIYVQYVLCGLQGQGYY